MARVDSPADQILCDLCPSVDELLVQLVDETGREGLREGSRESGRK